MCVCVCVCACVVSIQVCILFCGCVPNKPVFLSSSVTDTHFYALETESFESSTSGSWRLECVFVCVSVRLRVCAWAWAAPETTTLFFLLLSSKVNIPVLGRSMPSAVWSPHHVTPERDGAPLLFIALPNTNPAAAMRGGLVDLCRWSPLCGCVFEKVGPSLTRGNRFVWPPCLSDLTAEEKPVS